MKHTSFSHMKTFKQQGFTLVEIAIVLVIVGLLLGGVMKGQELINSAKVRSAVSKNQAVNMAWFSFQDRYQAKPGDFQTAKAQAQLSATSSGGDGNGTVTAQESDNVWEHLSLAGFISGSYPGTGNFASVDLCPTTPPAQCLDNGFGSYMNIANIPINNGGAAPLKHRLFSGKIPSIIAKEIDAKLDDGIPRTGAIQAYAGLGAACFTGALAASNYSTLPTNAIEDCYITNSNF